MKKLGCKRAAIGCAVLLAVCSVVSATAQETNDGGVPKLLSPATGEVPDAAMKSAQGRQLATRLRMLRHSEARMGPKHPSLPAVQNQIASIKEQLAAFGPDNQQTNDQAISNLLQSMSDEELRQLVYRMAVRIEQLEVRLQKLEKRMN